ncbi:MAG: hypothetical protein QNL04_05525 [SAR324 cluster bacterium]|nr:hypothetical protein [SAR324 cluster bacterium]
MEENQDSPVETEEKPPIEDESASVEVETEAEELSDEEKAEQKAVEDASKKKAAEKKKKLSLLPKDFSLRLATRITTINEREMDDHVANSRVADLVYRNMKDPEIHGHLLESLEILLENKDTQRYAAKVWVSLIWGQDEHREYEDYVTSVVQSCASGHLRNIKELWTDEDSGKTFSYFAKIIGECFIQMMKISSELYDSITEIFTQMIRIEMTRDLKKKEEAEKKKKLPRGQKVEDESNFNPKKLYDDVVDYISMRGDFRSDTLNQKNPNEFILVLADRMRSTRRYVIQDIMNRFALDKKKQLEKELKEREASAEEVIQAAKPYNHGLYLYWVEKRYNFKYLAVEKVRVTLEIMGFMLGITGIGAAYLQMVELSILESLLAAAMMFGFAKLFCSRLVFLPFYPKDVTAELEEDVGLYTPIFRKMSGSQMNSFISKQIRQPENNLLLHLLPEYMKYVFAVMPDRSNILMNKEEVNEMLERLESNISKFQRGG